MDGKEILMFTLDKGVMFLPEKRCLVARDSTVIELSENSYRFLLLLIRGETDKQDLINQVWSEQRGAVSESSYYRQLYLLRKAFTQVGLSNALIKTIPRRGVKYIGDVTKGTFQEPVPQDVYQEPLPERIEEEIETKDKVPVIIAETDTSYDESEPKKQSHEKVWYHSRSWNIFVSAMATLAVCWLTTLFFVLFFLWKR